MNRSLVSSMNPTLLVYCRQPLHCCVYPASKAAKFADKAEEAYDLALDYFRSADDVYHQVTVKNGWFVALTSFGRVYDIVLLEA